MELVLINPEGVTEEEVRVFTRREAARAVVFDQDKNVALLNVTKHGYYKLPGGGIEEGETREEAVKRECLEEIGCAVSLGQSLGEVVERRRKFKLVQHSYCFLANVVGEKGEPHMEQGEIDDGFQIEWYPLPDAERLLRESRPTTYEGNFIIARDLMFIIAAQ